MDIKIRSLLDKKGDDERIVLDIVKKTQLLFPFKTLWNK